MPNQWPKSWEIWSTSFVTIITKLTTYQNKNGQHSTTTRKINKNKKQMETINKRHTFWDKQKINDTNQLYINNSSKLQMTNTVTFWHIFPHTKKNMKYE